jgi:ADP-heptose:LPS heptosyltransferase
LFLHLDCQHYLGDRPCRFARLCEACPHYAPMGPRVLIIKLGALGDVVRTASLLQGMAKWPEPPHVTWVTSPAALPLVQRMPGVARAIPFTAEALARFDVEQFDIVFSLDKEAEPCSLAMRAHARERKGVGLSRYGTPFPLNEEAGYYFRLGLDNPEKFFVNRKSYQQLLFEALGLPYAGEDYRVVPREEDRQAAAARFAAAGVPAGGPLIGINAGAGKVFAHKAWREEGYVELIGLLRAAHTRAAFVMLGGRDETELMTRIAAAAGGPAASVFNPGSDLPMGEFIAAIERCDVVVSGDTLAMHLALATGRRSVAIFGPTCEQEIDLYGRGEKIVTTIECAPCYLRACEKSPHCQDLIPAARVAAAAGRQLDAASITN